MSDRYIKVFSLSSKLYVKDSPIIVLAGALLKDTETENIIAQLKFKNVSDKDIKALDVKLTLYDTENKLMEETFNYSYLDLSAPRDSEFGQKVPIILPTRKARYYDISVTKVVFNDNTTWQLNDNAFTVFEDSKPLSSVLDDSIILKEYLNKFNINVGLKTNLVPEKVGGLWYCACGAINREEESTCHLCQNEYSELLDCLKPEDLKSEYNAKQISNAIDMANTASASKFNIFKVNEALIKLRFVEQTDEIIALKESLETKKKDLIKKGLKIFIPIFIALLILIIVSSVFINKEKKEVYEALIGNNYEYDGYYSYYYIYFEDEDYCEFEDYYNYDPYATYQLSVMGKTPKVTIHYEDVYDSSETFKLNIKNGTVYSLETEDGTVLKRY